jgi:hypothetical protein
LIILKDRYKPTKFLKEPKQVEVKCEVLYALKLDGLLLNLLLIIDAEKIKTLRLFDDIKVMIGHKLNRLIKEPYIKNTEIELLFFKIPKVERLHISTSLKC